MRISTAREFRENTAGILKSKDPVLVTQKGRVAGIFFPWPEGTMPIELKREIFSVLSGEIRRQVMERGLSEDEIVEDFEAWRKARRGTRRRR